LFRCKHRCGCQQNCCCEPVCGCGAAGNGGAVDNGDAAPMPPAPMADPSASLRSKRRLIHATSVVRRR
jgi:hypothetical protein